ncbi:MAG TPA: antibiotic biosynthesis monooxygenase [Chitinophagaceae bacterium]|nr:antibiotic biosynthesis monooxygenase [Chitinophagaceae bacterium]
MIVRTWHGRTKTADAVIYRNYVEATGIKELTSTKGNLGAQIWQQPEGDITHIMVISWWDHVESIKAFAGKNITTARYYEEDEKYLMEKEPYVQHYECFDY